jgi:hypothetical protein
VYVKNEMYSYYSDDNSAVTNGEKQAASNGKLPKGNQAPGCIIYRAKNGLNQSNSIIILCARNKTLKDYHGVLKHTKRRA